ncbi:MAG: hypothetical protein NT036_02150, partial [Candidatus Omnitrophica bacterium]|nr:hypothetical protein [Candidatus Omnitrophota bacterium]
VVTAEARKHLNPDTFSLPKDLGDIKDSWAHSKQSLKNIIIHIQDAHCNYAAQAKIAQIVEYLNSSYGIDTVNLEGGAGDYDLSAFSSIKEKDKRDKAADHFVKEGLVNGSELFAINNPDKVKLWGIEDAKLYVENLSVYRNSLKNKDRIDKTLKSISYLLTNLKMHIYSKELLEFDTKYGQYKSGSLDFKEYLIYIIDKAEDLAVGLDQFKDISLLKQIFVEEKNIDFKKANAQRDQLIDRLQKELSKDEVGELVSKALEFRSDKLSEGDFYKYLAKKSKAVEIDPGAFPELKKYIAYTATYAAIDKVRIMEEVENIENRLKEALCGSDKERLLSLLSKNLALTKNIFNISITPDDYKYYMANIDAFRADKYIAFINREAALYKITAILDENISSLDNYREEMASFYECSLKRDAAFIKNIKCNKTAIVVTGGFHTENLKALFKKNNIAYVSIMPNFKNADGYESPYYKLLSGEKSLDVKDALPSVINKTLAIASPQNRAITDEVAAAGLSVGISERMPEEKIVPKNMMKIAFWKTLLAVALGWGAAYLVGQVFVMDLQIKAAISGVATGFLAWVFHSYHRSNRNDHKVIGLSVGAAVVAETLTAGLIYVSLLSLYILRIAHVAINRAIYNYVQEIQRGRNVSCGTICEAGHQELLDKQIGDYYEGLRKETHSENFILSSDEVLNALYITGKLDRFETTIDQFKEIVAYVRKKGKIPDDIAILPAIPPGEKDLWYIDNVNKLGEKLYAAGHFNRAGTRIHISLPFILYQPNPKEAALAIAAHEYRHIKDGLHDDNDEGMRMVREYVKKSNIKTDPHTGEMRLPTHEDNFVAMMRNTVTLGKDAAYNIIDEALRFLLADKNNVRELKNIIRTLEEEYRVFDHYDPVDIENIAEAAIRLYHGDKEVVYLDNNTGILYYLISADVMENRSGLPVGTWDGAQMFLVKSTGEEENGLRELTGVDEDESDDRTVPVEVISSKEARTIYNPANGDIIPIDEDRVKSVPDNIDENHKIYIKNGDLIKALNSDRTYVMIKPAGIIEDIINVLLVSKGGHTLEVSYKPFNGRFLLWVSEISPRIYRVLPFKPPLEYGIDPKTILAWVDYAAGMRGDITRVDRQPPDGGRDYTQWVAEFRDATEPITAQSLVLRTEGSGTRDLDIANSRRALQEVGEKRGELLDVLKEFNRLIDAGKNRELLGALLKILTAVRAPQEPRVFFIPRDESNKAIYDGTKSDIKYALEKEGFKNIGIVFYDGTQKDLDNAYGRQLANDKSVLNMPGALALAYVDSGMVDEATFNKHNEDNASYKWMRENIPQGVSANELFMHVAFGLPVLDFAKNSTDADHKQKLLDIIERMVDSDSVNIDLLKSDPNTIFTFAFILVLQKLDIDRDMRERELSLKEILTAA